MKQGQQAQNIVNEVGLGIEDQHWFAVRMAPPQNPGRRTVVMGSERSIVRGRDGRVSFRSKRGTGQRLFLSEVLLQRAGFGTFIPIRREWRQVNGYRQHKELIDFPLFGDWMFVGWPRGEWRWPELMDVGGVMSVLGTGGRPITIPGRTMARVMERWSGGRMSPEHRRYMRTGAEYEPGEVAKIIAGPLEGLDIAVSDVTGPRVRGLVHALSGLIDVEVSAWDVAGGQDT